MAGKQRVVLVPRRLIVAACIGLSALAMSGPAEPDGRIGQVRRLLEEKRYKEAEAVARDLVKAMEAEGHGDSLEAAEIMDAALLALDKNDRLRQPDARRLAERALEVRESLLGPDDPLVSASLARLAKVLTYLADYGKATAHWQRAIAITERSGPETPELARLLVGLAGAQREMGNFPKSRELCERALRIQESTLGPDHPDVASTLTALANTLKRIGSAAETRAAYERALSIRERALGPDDPDVALALVNLGNLLRQLGEFEDARALYERALSITVRSSGPESQDMISALTSLGNLHFEMGNDLLARPLYERALALSEKVNGPENARTAVALRNLANQLYDLGDLEKALELHRRALSIREKTVGPDNPLVAVSLQNIAEILRVQGDLEAALPLFERSLAIREKSLKPDHPDIARSLRGLANIMRDMGEDARARQLFERALAIRETALGPENSYTASSLTELADQLLLMNQKDAARPLYERAVAIRRKVVPTSTELVETLNHYASYLWSAGAEKESLDVALEAESIAREAFQQASSGLSEREALQFEQVHVSGLDLALSILTSRATSQVPSAAPAGGPLAPMAQRIWDNLIRSRSMVLDEMAGRSRARFSSGIEFDAVAKDVDRATDHLARMIVRGPGEDTPESYTARLRQAREDVEAAQRQFAGQSLEFRRKMDRQRVGLAEVKAALPAKTALVAYVQFSRISKVPSQKPVLSYLAFVLRSGTSAPAVVPLGEAGEIQRLVEDWRKEAAAVPEGLASAALAEERYRASGEALRKAVWDPIAREISGTRLVLIVADSALHLVSFATLPVEKSRYLVERSPVLHYLSTERDLVLDARPASKGTGLLAVGGIDFEARAEARLAEALPGGGSNGVPVSEVLRGMEPTCLDLSKAKFAPLPGSLAEVEEVESMWRQAATRHPENRGEVLKLTGAGADEGIVKTRSPGHRVLHFATHGFFAQPDQCGSMVEDARSSARVGLRGNGAGPISLGGNPLGLFGLALAGANFGAVKAVGQEDGILTSEEISALDLVDVEWAVLSACDTGLGNVITGEGVLGLRRAFEVAGARTLIMSLWSMADDPTRHWMKSLYQGRLRGLSTAEAVRRASLEMIAERRSQSLSTHPFYWGCFVAAGGWD